MKLIQNSIDLTPGKLYCLQNIKKNKHHITTHFELCRFKICKVVVISVASFLIPYEKSIVLFLGGEKFLGEPFDHMNPDFIDFESEWEKVLFQEKIYCIRTKTAKKYYEFKEVKE